jgi:hypothetical protein
MRLQTFLTFLVATSVFLGIYAFQKPDEKIDTFKKVSSINSSEYKLEDFISYTDMDGVMYFDTTAIKKLPNFSIDSLFHYYGDWFDFGQHNEPVFRRESTMDYSYFGTERTLYYDLFHKGIKLDCGGAYVTSKDDIPYSFGVAPCHLDVDTTVSIPENEVLELAKKTLDGEEFTWEKEGWEMFGGVPIPQKKIVKIQKSETYHLVYELHIPTTSLKAYEVRVSTKTGEIISSRSAGG